jgi:hypothetical protein
VTTRKIDYRALRNTVIFVLIGLAMLVLMSLAHAASAA